MVAVEVVQPAQHVLTVLGMQVHQDPEHQVAPGALLSRVHQREVVVVPAELEAARVRVEVMAAPVAP